MFSAFQTFGRLGAGGLPFSERALWPQSASSPGLWIDPAYTPSEFQDSAGTTPISTIGAVLDSSNPVGLMLDRKGGLQLGPELVTNGDFSNGATGWYLPSGWTVSGGVASGASGSNGLLSNGSLPTLTAGATYLVTFDFVSSGVACDVYLGGSASVHSSGNASFSAKIRTSSTAGIQIWPSGAGTLVIDNISVREIPGIHLSQSTSAARPVASARKNLLVGTATLSTQSVTVTAIPHTITFSGGGTVTASGTYSGALTSGQTFTPTAGTLTLTVSGSVTSAQLERGSAATSYQAVVSDSSYTATGFPQYLKFDGVDDALSSATFSAGTLTSSMDCLIAVRKDSTENLMLLYQASQSRFIGAIQNLAGVDCFTGAGSPTVIVDGTQLAGGTAVSRQTLYNAVTLGVWHIVEFRGLDLSSWVDVAVGGFTGGWQLNGAIGKILLFASGQDANRDKARARMAAYFGVTLP